MKNKVKCKFYISQLSCIKLLNFPLKSTFNFNSCAKFAIHSLIAIKFKNMYTFNLFGLFQIRLFNYVYTTRINVIYLQSSKNLRKSKKPNI